MTACVLGCGPGTGGDVDGGADGTGTEGVDQNESVGQSDDDGDEDDEIECRIDDDCDAGAVCVGGECVPGSDEADDATDDDGDDYGDDYGDDDDYDDDGGDDDSDEPPYDCYDSTDCEPGAPCEGTQCDYRGFFIACDEAPVFAALPVSGLPDGAIDVAFAEAETGDHLVIGTADGLFVVAAGTEAAGAIESPSEVHALTSADFDGDGVADVAAHAGLNILTLMLGDGTGSFVAGDESVLPVEIEQMYGARFEGDLPGVLAHATSNSVALYAAGPDGIAEDRTGTFVASQANLERHAASGDIDGDGYDDVLVSVGGVQMYAGGRAPSYEEPTMEFAMGRDGPAYRDPDIILPRNASGRDVVGVTQYEGWVRVQAWRDFEVVDDHALEGTHTLGTWGDIDGDGDSDLVLAGDSLRVLLGETAELGESDAYECVSILVPDVAITKMATGDLDGDGRDEIAFISDGTVTVLSAE